MSTAPTTVESADVLDLPQVDDARESLLRTVLRTRKAQFGFALMLLVVAIAFLGPLFAPYGATQVVATPFHSPSSEYVLGTDNLGRDVLSRFLDGGQELLLLTLLTSVLAYALGTAIGITAAYTRGKVDVITMAVVDVFVAIPSIVFALVLIAGLGKGMLIAAVGIAGVEVPRIARVVRGFALGEVAREYVEAAETRGEPRRWIVFAEVLPNLRVPIAAEFGVRTTIVFMLFAALSFLGLGASAPTANWALMINENRQGLLINPWPIIITSLTIAALTIGINLAADALARSSGSSAGS